MRKHVSYRHPGAPSPCDSESKRKRSRPSAAIAQASQMQRLQQLQQSPITRQTAIVQQQQQTSLTQQPPISSSPAESTSSTTPQELQIKTEMANDLTLTSALVQNLSMPSQLSAHIQNQLHGFAAMPCRPTIETMPTSPLKRESPTVDSSDFATAMTVQSKCNND